MQNFLCLQSKTLSLNGDASSESGEKSKSSPKRKESYTRKPDHRINDDSAIPPPSYDLQEAEEHAPNEQKGAESLHPECDSPPEEEQLSTKI
jgi:hypothetical protein